MEVNTIKPKRFLLIHSMIAIYFMIVEWIRLGPGQLLSQVWHSSIGPSSILYLDCFKLLLSNPSLIIPWCGLCFRWAQLMQQLIEGYQKAGLQVEWHFRSNVWNWCIFLGTHGSMIRCQSLFLVQGKGDSGAIKSSKSFFSVVIFAREWIRRQLTYLIHNSWIHNCKIWFSLLLGFSRFSWFSCSIFGRVFQSFDV